MGGIYTNLFMAFLRFKAIARGRQFFKLFKQLKKEQWLSPEEIGHLQTVRLKALLEHAVNKSKYYRDRFSHLKTEIEDIKSSADLQKFPLLTRDDLQNNFKEIVCPPPGMNVFPNSSGGSTGNPVNLFQDDIYREYSDAFELLFLSWFGLKRGDKTAIFWGAERDFPELPFKIRLMLKLERHRHLNSFHIDQKGLDTFLTHLNEFRPEYIYGYATSLELAAKYIIETGKFKIRPRVIRSTAETLYEPQKEIIEKAFDCPVYNFYGSREVNNLSAQCPRREGMHVFASGRIIEVVDENGRQKKPGELGYLAVTDLTNISFPVIRYMIGDMGMYKSEPCSCGRGYPLMSEVTGRTFEIMHFGEKYIHGHFFANLFLGHPEVKQFQIVQETNDLLIIKIVSPNRDLDIEPIMQKIRANVGSDVTVKLKFVEEIPPLSSGKYRYTINKTAM